MSDPKEYSIQEFSRDGEGELALAPAVVSVVARSPEEAANKTLGEVLYLVGEPRSVRAKAWYLDGGGRPLVTMLYARDAL